MPNFSRFVDGGSSRRYDNEQEGFDRAANVAPGELLVCGSCYNSFGMSIADFRGPALPAEGQLPDGTILTTWYGNLFGKFYVAVLRYRPEDL